MTTADRGTPVGHTPPPNPLTQLIRDRTDQLAKHGISIRECARRAGWGSPATINWHLYRTGPLEKMPREDVLEALSVALDVPLQRVWSAAVLAMLPEHPTPLQRLLREAQAKNGKRVGQLAKEAGISVMTLHRILGGEMIPKRGETTIGLAHAFGLTVGKVEKACANHVVYTLPPHLAARMTPEKWVEVLRVVEALVSGGGE